MPKPVILAVLLAATTSLFAQSLTEKIDVSLVNVDVTVTSRGTPARGLTRDDFTVFEDGVARPITNFYAVEPVLTGANRSTAPSAPDAVIADPTDERFRRKVLVVVDNRHVTMHNRDRALAALERFVDDRFTGGTYDWSIAFVSDKAHLLLPLTSDKQKLHESIAAIRRIVANPDRPSEEDVTRLAKVSEFSDASMTSIASGTVNGGLRDLVDFGTTFQMEADAAKTVDAIRESVRSFAGAPGRKIVLLVTGSLGFNESASPLNADPRSVVSNPRNIAASTRWATVLRDVLIREANASNVSFYIVNSEGLTPSSDATSSQGQLGLASSIGRPMSTGSSNDLATMYWLARETGGRLLPGNSPAKALAEFDRTSSSFYSLAYKPAHGEDGKYHSIKVELKQSGYQLQYRTGYSSLPVSVQLARAMQSPLGVTMQQSSIPIDIVTGNSAPKDGNVLVPLHATVPAKSLQFIPTGKDSVARIDLYVTVFDDRGRRISVNHVTREAHAANGTESTGNFVENRALLVKPGVPYRVVVAVHDQVTDAIGITSKMVRF
jgi:VWFA-related protein